MNKKVKNIAIILSIVVMLITLGIGGYTYAKYVTQVKANGSLDVAKWSFKVNEGNSQITTINLSETIDTSKLIQGKIAPGTGGEFTLKIDGTGSEVGIEYKVEFQNEKNKPTNLIFTYNGQTFNSIAEIQNHLKGTIDANDSNKIKDIVIGWQWPYETGEEALNENDEIDTQEGINDFNYTFDVVVTGTQIAI